MLIKRFFYITAFVVSVVSVEAQSPIDTVTILESTIDSCYGSPYHLMLQNRKYYYNEKQVTKEIYDKVDSFHRCTCDSVLGHKAGKYCKIYGKKGILVEEGIWYAEFFTGPYKKYYPNGKLMEEGNYAEYHGKVIDNFGAKVGRWSYYKENGHLKRAVYYDKNGNIIKSPK